MRSGLVPWGERMSSGTRFINLMADRLPPLRWLLGILPSGRGLVILIPYVWLVAFFLIPFIIVAKISLSESVTAQPPYTEIVRRVASGQVSFAAPEKTGDAAGATAAAPAAPATTTQTSSDQGSVDTPDQSAEIKGGPPEDVSGGLYVKFNWDNYDYLFSDALYYKAGKNAVFTAFISTVMCLLIGFPMAYGIARSPAAWRGTLLMLIILPFWTSFLIRVYAWIGILKNNGIINNLLIWLGVIHDPLPMMNTNFAVFIGIVYSYLPFMILPLYSTLEKMDLSLLEAAADLGCRPWKAFLQITVPLAMPGIIAGSMLVFIPAVGEYVIPELLGGPDSLMIGRVLSNEFFSNRDWPVASAVAIAILVLLVIPIVVFQYYQNKQQEAAT
jgi:putrescine transport system permease protein